MCTRSHNHSLIQRRVSTSVVHHLWGIPSEIENLSPKKWDLQIFFNGKRKVSGTRFSHSPFRVYLFYIRIRTLKVVKNTVFSLFVAWGCWCRNFLSTNIFCGNVVFIWRGICLYPSRGRRYTERRSQILNTCLWWPLLNHSLKSSRGLACILHRYCTLHIIRWLDVGGGGALETTLP
jgi:hypothetical protein